MNSLLKSIIMQNTKAKIVNNQNYLKYLIWQIRIKAAKISIGIVN